MLYPAPARLVLPATLFLAAVSLATGCGDSKADKDSPAPEGTPVGGEQQTPPPTAPETPPKPGTDDARPAVLAPSEGIAAEGGAFVVKLTWVAGPVAEDYSRARLTFATADRRAPATVTDIGFDPRMPSMNGHGTAVDDQVIAPVSGQPAYEIAVDGIYFIMGGPWVVNVTATVDGRTGKALVPVDVP